MSRNRDRTLAGDLLRYLVGRFLWVTATQIVNVALGWHVYEQTKSPLALGFVGLAAFTPKLVLTLAAGMVADRGDRRLVLAASLAINAFVAVALGVLAATAQLPVVWVYPFIVLMGISRSFTGPAAQALVPSLVPRAELSRAAGMTSTVTKVATIVGPAFGGAIYMLAPWAPFICSASFFALAVALNLAIRTCAPVAAKPPIELSETLEGIRYVARHPVILGAISLDLFSVLLGGVTALLPIIVSELLEAGPATLGLLRSMPSAGAMVVALAISWKPIRRRAGKTLLAATAIFGLATIGLAFSTNVVFTSSLLWLIGASDVVSVVIRQTLVLADSPDEMRGRVAAVNMLFVGTSNELGEFESGVTAALFGLVPAILIGGVGTVCVVLFWAMLFPELRQRDQLVCA